MPLGPGVYDHLATVVRERAHANGVVLIVLEGSKGNGFSVQATVDMTLTLPSILRTVADEIEQSFGRG